MTDTWQTAQFVPADSPTLNHELLGLEDWLVAYMQSADKLLGFVPDYTIALGPPPAYEVFTGKKPTPAGDRTHEILRDAVAHPTHEAIAIAIRVLCEAVALAREAGNLDAAVVNGMRAEALAKQLEYDRKIAPFARHGLNAKRNIVKNRSNEKNKADDRVVSNFKTWEQRVSAVLSGKSLSERLDAYFTAFYGKLKQRDRKRLLSLVNSNPALFD